MPEGRLWSSIRTIPASLRALQYALVFITVYGWGYLMAGAVLTTLPVIAAYIYLQKYMVEGLTAGSVKGQPVSPRWGAPAGPPIRSGPPA